MELNIERNAAACAKTTQLPMLQNPAHLPAGVYGLMTSHTRRPSILPLAVTVLTSLLVAQLV